MPGIDSYTKFCLQSETTDGSTVFVDSSFSDHGLTETAAGIVQQALDGTPLSGGVYHTTDDEKFGVSSLYISGDSYLLTPASVDFNLSQGDSTVDFWIAPKDPRYDATVLYSIDDGSDNSYWSIEYQRTYGRIKYSFNAYYNKSLQLYASISANVWSHIAIVWNGSLCSIYVNGTLATSSTLAHTGQELLENILYVGGVYAYPFAGNLEELRISKGIARWTADFTPPTAPYNILPAGVLTTELPIITGEATAEVTLFADGELETEVPEVVGAAQTSLVCYGTLETQLPVISGLAVEYTAPRLAFGTLLTRTPDIVGLGTTAIIASGILETKVPVVTGLVIQNYGNLETELPEINSTAFSINKAFGILNTKKPIIVSFASVTNVANGICRTRLPRIKGTVLDDVVAVDGYLVTKTAVLIGTAITTNMASGVLTTQLPRIHGMTNILGTFSPVVYDRSRRCNL